MANGFDHDVNPTSVVDGRVIDDGSGQSDLVPDETPEDVVRRLMETQTGAADPAPIAKRATAKRRKAQHTESRFSRLATKPRRIVGNTFSTVRASVLSYRPRPRHMAGALVVVIALTMPWLIPVLVLLGLFLVVVTYLSLGHHRTAELVAGWFGRLVLRNPQGAEQLRSRAERVSARLTKWSGFLPDSWTSGLYLPDFAVPDQASDELAGDPFDRLASDPQNQ